MKFLGFYRPIFRQYTFITLYNVVKVCIYIGLYRRYSEYHESIISLHKIIYNILLISLLSIRIKRTNT